MRQIYFVFVLSLITTSAFAQTGSACDNPLDANIPENRMFTGDHNVEQWFTYTASKTGKIVVSSCGLTAEDTYVRIYPGGVCIPLVLKVESDDHCSLQSKVAFIGTEGYDYLIVWTNKSSSKSFNWSISEEAWQQGELCSLPLNATEGNTNIADHSNATDQWFSYTSVSDGKITVSSRALTTENTSVRIYDDCAGIQLVGNDDFNGEQSEVEFDVIKDQPYLIRWEKKAISGSYNWSLLFEGAPTAVDNARKNEVEVVYSNGLLRIKLSKPEISTVKLFNLSGALVKTCNSSSAEIEVNCGGLVKGVYIVQLKLGSEVVTRKVLIK